MADTRMVLVGRDRHLRELESFVHAVVAGSGYVVVLSGEAGAGKTALAHEAVRIAELTSVRVRWATCWRSSTAPLSVWTELVDAAGTGSARTPLASGSDADPGGARAAW